MTRQEAQELLNKYAQGTCTPEEKVLVERWYQHELSSKSLTHGPDDHLNAKSEIWDAIAELNGLDESKNHTRKIISKVGLAAAIIIILSTGAYFYRLQKPDGLADFPKKEIETKTDVEPAKDKAILTLADGSKILLDDRRQGLIATQQGIKISKLSDGTITYQALRGSALSAKAAYNTIETPRGAKYQIVLPDGSRVWLNAESSLRFPATFTGKERDVQLEGEAFFEVSKNRLLPFRVHTKDMNVLVTGTQFNVMAYKDEMFSATTLVEGSVDIKNAAGKLSLSPGEQAVNTASTRLSKSQVDVEQFIAWKNGLFQFNNTDIQSVMKQVSRWYDVSVEYGGKIPQAKFGGYMSRDSKLSQVIKMLELSGVKFSVEDKRIIVLP